MADQGNDLGVENLDVLKRQHPCLFFLAIRVLIVIIQKPILLCMGLIDAFFQNFQGSKDVIETCGFIKVHVTH